MGAKTRSQKCEWNREGPCVALQCEDNKFVIMLSTIDLAHMFVEVTRKVKEHAKWKTDSQAAKTHTRVQ